MNVKNKDKKTVHTLLITIYKILEASNDIVDDIKPFLISRKIRQYLEFVDPEFQDWFHLEETSIINSQLCGMGEKSLIPFMNARSINLDSMSMSGCRVLQAILFRLNFLLISLVPFIPIPHPALSSLSVTSAAQISWADEDTLYPLTGC